MSEEMGQMSKVKIDLIVIGNPNSGKTSLIRRFIDGESTFVGMQHLSISSILLPWA